MEEFFKEWAAWIIGVAAAAWLAVQTRCYFWTRELTIKHRQPDTWGFGSAKTNELATQQLELLDKWTASQRELLNQLVRYQKDQVHYMRWMARELTQKEPPPPINEG